MENNSMYNRPKMTSKERAKQFMPFAALKGYEEALREKEELRENYDTITRDSEEDIEYKRG